MAKSGPMQQSSSRQTPSGWYRSLTAPLIRPDPAAGFPSMTSRMTAVSRAEEHAISDWSGELRAVIYSLEISGPPTNQPRLDRTGSRKWKTAAWERHQIGGSVRVGRGGIAGANKHNSCRTCAATYLCRPKPDEQVYGNL